MEEKQHINYIHMQKAKENDYNDAVDDTGNGGWRTYRYRNYSDWKDDGGETVNGQSVSSVKSQ